MPLPKQIRWIWYECLLSRYFLGNSLFPHNFAPLSLVKTNHIRRQLLVLIKALDAKNSSQTYEPILDLVLYDLARWIFFGTKSWIWRYISSGFGYRPQPRVNLPKNFSSRFVEIMPNFVLVIRRSERIISSKKNVSSWKTAINNMSTSIEDCATAVLLVVEDAQRWDRGVM